MKWETSSEISSPLFVGFIALSLGLLTIIFIDVWSGFQIIFPLLFVFLLLFYRKALWKIMLPFYVLGIVLALTIPALESTDVEYVGIINSGSYRYYRSSRGYLLDYEYYIWHQYKNDVELILSRVREEPKIGERIWVAGEIERINRYPFYRINVQDYGIIPPDKIHYISNIFRENLIYSMQSNGINSVLPFSVFFGGAIDMERNLEESVRNVGISHIFAVSGLHVSLLYLLLRWILSLLLIDRKLNMIITIGALGFYVLSTGPAVSALRAFLVLLLYTLFSVIDYKQSTFNVLGLAGIIMLVVSPMIIVSVSFQLSFLATSGILLMVNTFDYSRMSFLKKAILVGIGAQIAVLPISVATFGTFSLLTIPLTIITVPLFVFPVYLGTLMVFIFDIFKIKPLAQIMARGIEAISNIFEKSVLGLSKIIPAFEINEGWRYPLALSVSLFLFCSFMFFFRHSGQRP
ncbi:MAG: ComEC/Rec2 family competence protein [Kosmotoga sp.]|nr:MAG: ComEC/Rec2 family competence protein [Kosmotoga sp.]